MSTHLSFPASYRPNRPHRRLHRPPAGAPDRRRHSEEFPPSGEPLIRSFYDALYGAHGRQHWWPARSQFEVIVGAILTQNTSWNNVERAIGNLRLHRLLSVSAIRNVSTVRLARLIRSSGYFRQKARKLKAFVRFLDARYRGSLRRMFREPTAALRDELLQVHGIGPETADSILLYAGNHPVFVIDAYTRRILERHQIAHGRATYEGLRGLFEASLPNDPALFNEYHALIVHTGKHYCRTSNPLCSECPLQPFLPAPVSSAPTAGAA